MTHKTLKSALVVTIAGLMSTTALADETYSDIDKIEIDLLSGGLVLEKSSSDDVVLITSGRFNSSAIEVDGNTLIIDEERRSRRNRSYGRSRTITLQIPDNMEVDFDTASGGVEISNLVVNLRMSSGSGSLKMEDSSGEIRISTGSGDFEGENISLQDGSKFSTGSGDIEATNLTLTGYSQFSTGSGDIYQRNITFNGDGSFSTGSGDVEIELAGTTQYDVALSTGSGDATLDLNGHDLAGTLVVGYGKRRGRYQAPFEFDSIEEFDQGRRSSTYVEMTKKFTDANVETSVSTGSGTARVIP